MGGCIYKIYTIIFEIDDFDPSIYEDSDTASIMEFTRLYNGHRHSVIYDGSDTTSIMEFTR